MNASKLVHCQAKMLLLLTGVIAGSAWGQLNNASQIPGLGAGIQPKVMIIFDTSRSMQHMPQSNLNDPSVLYNWPAIDYFNDAGNYRYLNNDFDPVAPSSECLNRFCIAKRVLYTLLPAYSNDVQLGLAGYYQYRTAYTVPAGTSACVYDVLAAPGESVTFSSSVAGLNGSFYTPPGVAQSCRTVFSDGGVDPLAQYRITSVTNMGGTVVNCSVYSNIGAGPYAPGVKTELTAAGCNNSAVVTYSPSGPPSATYGSGVSAMTSTMWVATSNPAYCTTPGNPFRYAPRAGFFTDFTVGPTAFSSPGVPNMFLGTSPTVASPAAGGVIWSGQAPGCSFAAPCDLETTGAAALPDARRSVRVFYTDAGSGDITVGTIVYSPDGGATFELHGQTGALADGGCEYAPGIAATLGTDYYKNTGTMADWGFPRYSCAYGGVGCRVRFAGTTSLGPVTYFGATTDGNRYTWASPGGAPRYPCDVTGSLVNGSWARGSSYAPDVDARGPGVTCPDVNGLTSAAIGGQPVNGTAGYCTPGTPCDLQAGRPYLKPDPALHLSPLAAPGALRDAGFGPYDHPTIQLTSYVQTCPGPAVAGSWFDDDGTIFASGNAGWVSPEGHNGNGCELSGHCHMTFDNRDNAAGGGPPAQRHRSGSIPNYSANGGTYSYSGASVLTSDKWEVALLAGRCAASLTLNSNEVLPSGFVCSATEPCELGNATEVCRDPDGFGLMTCPSGSDVAALHRCQYTSSDFLYTAPNFGVCKYTRYQSQYGTDWCAYELHSWTPVAPPSGCDHYRTFCNYDATAYPYSYDDPVSYCQVTGSSRPWSGTTPRTYLYSYLTKGGEYIGRKDLTQDVRFAATAPLATRNWCDAASPFPYSAFSSACPAAITATNNSSYWGDATCAGGRECLLRVRGNAGPDFPTARASYFKPSAIVPEVLNPAAPLCLAPDRPGGETTQFDPAPFMPNADGGSADSLPPTTLACPLNLYSGWWQQCPTNFTGLVPGNYTLTVSAYQDAAGPADATMALYVAPAGSPDWAYVNVGTYAVSNGAPDQPLYTANITVTGTSLSVRPAFTNDWYCGSCTPADRNLFVRKVSLSRAPTNFCAGFGRLSPTRVNLRSDWYDPGQPSNVPPYVDFSTQQTVRNSGWSYADGGSDIFVPMASNNLGPVQQALGRCARPTNLTSPAAGGLCLSDLSTCGTGSQPCQSNDAGLPDFTPLYGSLDNALSYMRDQLSTDDGSYACRDYYVLLVTDGLESTPKHYSQSDLNTLVTSLRTTTTSVPAPRTKDVKTYVIGFGAGLTGDGGLTDVDIIARAGGTALKVNPNPTSLYDAFLFDNVNGKALAATDQAQLGQALNWVFSTISAGRFARSRPVLSSSGGRLYQGYFERGVTDGGTSPELKGNVVAFELSVTGALTRKWDYQTKLDNQATRDVRAALSTGDGGVRLVNFVAANNDVTATMDSLWGTTDAGVGVVAFIRNDSLGTGADETYAPVVVPRRTRAGPVMFSAPTIVGPGRTEWRSGYGGNATEASQTSYQGFFDAWVGRPQRVLFGSGDGLWRGVAEGNTCADESSLACANGREAWGLVPPEALRSLQTIRQGGALPVVDGTTTAADVCWPSVGSNAADCGAGDWRTIAISAMRGGGRGILAADVTDGGYPTPMWTFSGNSDDDHLGYTYSSPAIGRITIDGSGTKRWVAFMAGGLNDDGAGHDGNSFFIFDLQKGKPKIGVSAGHNDTSWSVSGDGTSFTGKTALFRPVNPPSVDVRAAYFGGTDGYLYDVRLKLDSFEPDRDWKPEVFFAPRCTAGTCGGADRARDDAKQYPGLSANTPLWTINKTTGLQGTTGCTLPLGDLSALCTRYNVSPKFMNRPTLATASDPSLQRPDVYIGTGDAIDVSSVAPSEQNFLFAIHDTARPDATRNTSSSVNPSKRSRNDHYGQAMWAYALDVGEKVLGEPALIGGSVIFATYVPVGNGCTVLGDSYLYAFDPVTGAPRAALFNPATGSYVSVLKLEGAGPLSDLVVAANKLWFAPTRSTGAPESVDVRGANYRGVIHGWRRVR